MLTILAICGVSAQASPSAPSISIRSASAHLPGRFDQLAVGSNLVVITPAPPGVPVTWYRDGTMITTTPEGVLTLPNLTLADTGNLEARWPAASAATETVTTLLPITVGPLPASHFGSSDLAVKETADTNAITPLQFLADGRVAIDTLTWGQVGQYHAYQAVDPTHVLSSTTFYETAWYTPFWLGQLTDGSFYLSDAPYRYLAPAEPAPFSLPPGFEDDLPRRITPYQDWGILLSNGQRVTTAYPDGRIWYSRTAAQLGGTQIDAAFSLPQNRLAVVVVPTVPAHADEASRTLVLNASGEIDPAFQPIPHRHRYLSPTALADGSWALLSGGSLERWSAAGQPLPSQTLPLPGLWRSTRVAPSGELYTTVAGLGILRFQPDTLVLDPTFFLPVQFAAGSTPSFPLVASDQRIAAVTFAADIASFQSQVSLATYAESHQSAAPIIGRQVLVSDLDLSTQLPIFRPSRAGEELRPSAGQPLDLLCPFFSPTPATAVWHSLDGTTAPDPTTDGRFHIPAYSSLYAGRYQLRVTNAHGTALGPVIDLRAHAQPRLVNLSGRARINQATENITAGFVLQSRTDAAPDANDPVDMLLRGMGPTLTQFGIADPLPDPRLELHRLSGERLATNDQWTDSTRLSYAILQRLGAFSPLVTSLDASIYTPLPPGAYTIQTLAKPDQNGVALTEIYLDDLPLDRRTELVNLSLRGHAGSGENALVAGFVIDDPDHLARPLRLLIRGIGPQLGAFGVPGTLANPNLQIFNATGERIAENDDWGTTAEPAQLATAAATIGAFELPADSLDAAILIELPAGAYTAHVEPTDSNLAASGTALLEIYRLP